MMLIIPLAEVLQEAIGATQAAPPPPFNVFALGKALFSVSFFAILTFSFAVRGVWRGRGGTPEQRALARLSIDTSLFWGLFTFAVGLFHTFTGLLLTALRIRAAAPVEPGAHQLIAGGIAASLGASVYGLLVLLITALVWYGFRHRHSNAVLQGT